MIASSFLKFIKILGGGVFLVVLIIFDNLTVRAAQREILKPNEMGLIPMLEYHRIGNAERAFTRSAENFRKDLQWLYNNNYVLISVEDFINQRFSLAAGKKPVMISFDDSTLSQFRYLEDGSIDPDSAIGILDDFYQKHADFGRSVIFYVNETMFEQPEYKKKKLDYLLTTGREIGNHTAHHKNISKMSADEIRTQIGSLAEYIQNLALRPVNMTSFAYPFGGVPKTEDGLKALSDGTYNRVSYSINTAFLVGADPSHPPYSVKFEPLFIPRIQAIDEEWKRWFEREAGSTASNPDSEVFSPFISDGCPNLLTLAEKRLASLNRAKVRPKIEVCVLGKDDCEKKIAKCEVSDLPSKEGFFQGIEAGGKIGVSSGSGFSSESRSFSGSGSSNDSVTVIQDGEVFKKWQERSIYNFSKLSSAVNKSIPEFSVNTLPPELHYELGGYRYTVQSGDSTGKIAIKFLAFTSYYLPSQLEEEIVAKNNLKEGTVTVGQELLIPAVEMIIYDRKINADTRKGIYWTAYTASSKNGWNQVKKLKEHGGNAVVIDVKEVEGVIFYQSEISFAKEHNLVRVRINDFKKLVRTLHREGIYVIARMTVFKDMALGKARPDLAPKIKGSNSPWTNREGVVWVDPSNTEVQDYNIAIAEEVAKMGVDEVQFDYVRFPEKSGNDGDYGYDESIRSREDIITEFVKRADEKLTPYGIRLSADLFGVVAWNNGFDGKIIGQDVRQLSKYLDVIYPMVYPSHFGPGFGGVDNPGGEPYYFVNESLKKFVQQSDRDTEIIPWIQGFSWGATGYGTDYIRKQIKGAEDLGIHSFLIWNAANNYDVSWEAI